MNRPPNVNITFSELEEKFVAELVHSGAFRSAEDVVKHALESFRAQETFIYTNADKLRAEIEVGLEQIRRGEVVDGKVAIQRLRQKFKQNLRSPGKN